MKTKWNNAPFKILDCKREEIIERHGLWKGTYWWVDKFCKLTLFGKDFVLEIVTGHIAATYAIPESVTTSETDVGNYCGPWANVTWPDKKDNDVKREYRVLVRQITPAELARFAQGKKTDKDELKKENAAIIRQELAPVAKAIKDTSDSVRAVGQGQARLTRTVNEALPHTRRGVKIINAVSQGGMVASKNFQPKRDKIKQALKTMIADPANKFLSLTHCRKKIALNFQVSRRSVEQYTKGMMKKKI